MRGFGLFAVASLLLVLVAGCAPQQQSGDIYFGVSAPMTGDNAEYGRIWKRAMDLAVDEVNANGGIKGRKLQLVVEDSQSDPKQSVTVAEKFVNDKRIVAELGDFSSPASMAASPIYQRGGLVQFAFTSSHPDFTKGGDHMFSIAPNQRDDAPFLASYTINDLGKKRIALLHQNTDWGKTTSDLYEARAKELGAEIVYRDAYLPTEKDFKTILTKVRDANPDALALISYYTDGAVITQQARAQGLNQTIVANGATYSPQLLELGGPSVEGLHTTSVWFPGGPRPEVQEFVKRYEERYGEKPNLFAAISYDATKMLAHVAEKSGADRKAIRDGLASLKDYPSLLYGPMSFDDQRRVAKMEFVRLVIKGGNFAVWPSGA